MQLLLSARVVPGATQEAQSSYGSGAWLSALEPKVHVLLVTPDPKPTSGHPVLPSQLTFGLLVCQPQYLLSAAPWLQSGWGSLTFESHLPHTHALELQEQRAQGHGRVSSPWDQVRCLLDGQRSQDGEGGGFIRSLVSFFIHSFILSTDPCRAPALGPMLW